MIVDSARAQARRILKEAEDVQNEIKRKEAQIDKALERAETKKAAAIAASAPPAPVSTTPTTTVSAEPKKAAAEASSSTTSSSKGEPRPTVGKGESSY